MVDGTDAQIDAALGAAKARQAIAEMIGKLVPSIQKDADAQIVLHLAEAYANLATEPPRVRAPESCRRSVLVRAPFGTWSDDAEDVTRWLLMTTAPVIPNWIRLPCRRPVLVVDQWDAAGSAKGRPASSLKFPPACSLRTSSDPPAKC
jgi:hypothetical protein